MSCVVDAAPFLVGPGPTKQTGMRLEFVEVGKGTSFGTWQEVLRSKPHLVRAQWLLVVLPELLAATMRCKERRLVLPDPIAEPACKEAMLNSCSILYKYIYYLFLFFFWGVGVLAL